MNYETYDFDRNAHAIKLSLVLRSRFRAIVRDKHKSLPYSFLRYLGRILTGCSHVTLTSQHL